MLEGLYGCWMVCRDVGRSVRMLDGLYGCLWQVVAEREENGAAQRQSARQTDRDRQVVC